MPRFALRLIVLAVALAVVAVPAGAVSPEREGTVAASPVAFVKVTECARAPGARSVEFRGAMRRVARTRRMWMRFSLEERVGSGSFVPIDAPDLGVWRKSRAGVRGFAYRQRVLALAEGSSYRTVVRYRWYDRRGRLIKRARRTSRLCVQPGPLSNLRVARIGARPTGERTLVRYAVDVVNRGIAPSVGTTVSVAVDGSIVDTVRVAPLAPGGRVRVFVRGPRCETGVEARVDPDDNVRERSERDNVRSIRCPAA